VTSLIEKGVIPLYVKVLGEEDRHIVDQAIWGVGNIAGDSIQYRDMLLKSGAMRESVKLYERLKYKDKRAFIQQILWASSNMCRLKPTPDLHMIAPSIGMFSEGLKQAVANLRNDASEEATITDCAWALSQMACP
jgi:importin subunit alpha-6/7